MKIATSFALAMAVAVAGLGSPVMAAPDDAPSAVSRDWKRNSGGSTVSRGTALNHRGTTTNSRSQTIEVEPDVPAATVEARSNRNWSRDGRSDRGYRNRAYENDGLDHDEARRIARAHRESHGHPRLHRYDRYDYETPYYAPPRRHHWWWSFWW